GSRRQALSRGRGSGRWTSVSACRTEDCRTRLSRGSPSAGLPLLDCVPSATPATACALAWPPPPRLAAPPSHHGEDGAPIGRHGAPLRQRGESLAGERSH